MAQATARPETDCEGRAWADHGSKYKVAVPYVVAFDARGGLLSLPSIVCGIVCGKQRTIAKQRTDAAPLPRLLPLPLASLSLLSPSGPWVPPLSLLSLLPTLPPLLL